VLLSVQLLIPPIVGLADNHDYDRVMGWFGIVPAGVPEEQRYVDYVERDYDVRLGQFAGGGYLSSELGFAALAVALSPLVPSPADLDLRVVGAVHGAALLAALWLLLVGVRPLHPAARITAAALAVLILTDVAYVAYLNSFYSEPASLVFLLAFAGLALSWLGAGMPGGWLRVGVLASAVGLITSKPQNGVLGLVLAGAALWLATGARARGAGATRFLVLTAVGLAVGSLVYVSVAPSAIRRNVAYHAVFWEILPNSPAPLEDAAALGLDPAWLRFSRTTAFAPESGMSDPAFRRDFLRAVGPEEIAGFYLRRPGRVAAAIGRGATAALEMRPAGLANVERRTGAPPRTQTSAFSIWSSAKRRLLGSSAPLVAVVLAAALIVPLRRRRSVGASRAVDDRLLALFATMAVAELGIVVLGEGDLDLARRLFLFHALVDLCAAGLAVAAVHWLATRPSFVKALVAR